MKAHSATCIEDLKAMAKKRLPTAVYDFVEGGVEDEVALAVNRAAFERVRFLPRYCVDTSNISLKRSVLGNDYESPFGIAPTGLAGLFRPGSDLALARAACDAGVPFTLSGASNCSLEQIISEVGTKIWFQIYGSRDRRIVRDLVRRAVDSGVETLVLTIDVPVNGRRQRNLRNRFAHPYTPGLAGWMNAAMHPRWVLDYMRGGGFPNLENWKPYAEKGAKAGEIARLFAAETPDPGQTWIDIDRIRELWPHKLIVKGILAPQDATRAREIGADGIVVSNHGGRQLDRAPSSLDALPAVREAAGRQTAIILDSGVTRGADILSAICLGADFVLVGRATLYGAIAGGYAGAAKAIELLNEEIKTLMQQIGARTIDDLGPGFLWAPPGCPAYVGSANFCLSNGYETNK